MSSLWILGVSLLLISCSSFQNANNDDKRSPGYQYGRQMDEGFLKAGFKER